MTEREMYCWSCYSVTKFTVVDPEEGPVCDCGHYQYSEAQGAADICRLATWSCFDEYQRLAAIASAGGFTVPDYPVYVDISDIH